MIYVPKEMVIFWLLRRKIISGSLLSPCLLTFNFRNTRVQGVRDSACVSREGEERSKQERVERVSSCEQLARSLGHNIT